MDQNSSSSSSFDLHSQAGVMSLLASIRGSQLSATAKNELRDLVFLYTNGGGDNSVRLALEQKLATHQITPIAPVAKPLELINGGSAWKARNKYDDPSIKIIGLYMFLNPIYLYCVEYNIVSIKSNWCVKLRAISK